MRPLLLAVMLVLSSATLAAPEPAAQTVQADWRRDGVNARVKAALTGSGWRLEDDGRALDPKTKAAVTKAVLDKAVLDLLQGTRRAALETVSLMLASGKPLEITDKQKIAVLSADISPALASAIFDPKSDMNKVKAMADADLSRVAAYFDGGRTLADRRAAARPVSAGTPGPRINLPYYTSQEQSVGEEIRASAEAEIGRDPFGKTVLSRLNGKNGKPALPPILIEDQNGTVVAQYDFRRGTVVLDREAVLSSIIASAPPRSAFALRSSLSTRAALMAYLEAHPEAVSAVVKDNDVVLVHELTHAWQDRRDPIFREIARGNLPDVQPLEYEEEASVTKNMFLHSKLKNDPASVKMDGEFADYTLMMHARGLWRKELLKGLNDSSPSRALPLRSIQDIQAERIARTQGRPVAAADDQQAKALDLSAMGRGQQELAALKTAHNSRMSPINGEIDKAGPDGYKVLGNYYLIQAQFAARPVDRSALLDQADNYAQASGDAALIEKARKAKENKK